jgi:hypothetical protein
MDRRVEELVQRAVRHDSPAILDTLRWRGLWRLLLGGRLAHGLFGDDGLRFGFGFLIPITAERRRGGDA